MNGQIHVLTLNCWALPLGLSKHCKERIVKIGEVLATGKYDIVALQEVFGSSYYEVLRKMVRNTMPYSHYFKSGLVGSGVCVFSKGRILETFQHSYSINGYPHMIHHADWFAGKMVGLCRIQHKQLAINFFVTHLHAEYNCAAEYSAHRLVQVYEMSKLVRLAAHSADLNIVAGDLNLEPHELHYQVLTGLASLTDSWEQCQSKDSVTTFGSPSNPFSSSSPKQRLDYIMYSSPGLRWDLHCLDCSTTLGPIPDLPYHYSDHEGCQASFSIQKRKEFLNKSQSAEEVGLSQDQCHILRNITTALQEKLSIDRRRYFRRLSCLLLYVVLLCSLHCFAWIPYIAHLASAFLFCLFFYTLWLLIVSDKYEMDALQAISTDAMLLLKHSGQEL